MSRFIQVIDSHTGGEPTRTVVQGFPDLGGGQVRQQLTVLREQHDHYRSAVILEPRGHDVLVGALLCPPALSECVTGVIFFNNAGYLGMCGHGLIGVVSTLAHLGRIKAGQHRIETPVGIVTAILHENGSVSVRNIPCHRLARQVTVEVPEIGTVTGDVAWGGNWFFLAEIPSLELSLPNLVALTDITKRIRAAVNEQGFPLVDHVELFGPAQQAGNDSRNFVLCPGGEYDRSPCGTGTSAKIACLAADGKLQPGDVWKQESILGSVFEGSYESAENGIIPTITGRAFVTAEIRMILDAEDPFRWGVGFTPSNTATAASFLCP